MCTGYKRITVRRVAERKGILIKMRKKREEIKLLLKIKDNRRWYLKNCFTKWVSYFTGFITAWTLLDAFNINFTTLLEKIIPGSTLVVLVIALLACIVIAGMKGVMELIEYSHIRVEPERAGCSVEIRVADSYLTNAFTNYQDAAMIIGINKAFWFQEAEPGSLIDGMWDKLKEKHIDKKDVQKKIDEELALLWTNEDGTINEEKKAGYIDTKRKTVRVKSEDNPKEGLVRDNYKIGTIIGVDLTWEEEVKEKDKEPITKKVLKKLYLIANSEVVQGVDMSEPMKVTYDRKASVVESFYKIWEFFEEEEKMTERPPKHILYSPLLMPLIGGGVANEGYTDMEIFSQIVDLYYENLRKSIREGKQPAIPNLIINIQSKTAIETREVQGGNNRKIDLKTAFWYLKYRNQVNPVVKKHKNEEKNIPEKDAELL